MENLEIEYEDKCRCNNCMTIFESDSDLEILYEEINREFFKGCPNCETDAYLMDLEQQQK